MMETTTRSPKSYLDALNLRRERRESGFSEEMYLSPPLAVESRRDSYDSGLSESPSPLPLFQLELEQPAAVAAAAAAAVEDPKKAKAKTKKKKRLCESLSAAHFEDVYRLAGEVLGEGSQGRVETCVNVFTGREFAVKIISVRSWHFNRSKILKEIELYHLCRSRKEIVQLVEYFEEDDAFYLVFEKSDGGPLLRHVQKRVRFTEGEAATVVRDLAVALSFLHAKGIAHRDLKLENVLCDGEGDNFLPIKLCDFDLCSAVYQTVTTPRLRSPVGSVEYMAPEVVVAFVRDLDFVENDYDDEEGEEAEPEELTYDKRCDLWSLGVIAYVLLCGYVPFAAGGSCGRDCGWDDRGEECADCQQRLFRSIRSGSVVFHEQHWSHVSKDAKDLIAKLLVLDPSLRMEASSVLNHPWIAVNDEATRNTCDDLKPKSAAIDISPKQKKLSFAAAPPPPPQQKLVNQQRASLVLFPEHVADNRWEF